MKPANSYTYEYRLKAYALNPTKPGKYLLYNGTVDRHEEIINGGNDFDHLLIGLSDYFFSQLGVRIGIRDIVVLSLELINSTEPTLHEILHPTED